MTLNTYRRFFITLFGQRWGLELSPVRFNATGERYLDRYILYLGPINLRLHKFYRGDDMRAPHDHPWWFITFPFASYVELWSAPYAGNFQQRVAAWRLHFRPAKYRHIVIGREDSLPKPFWTFVIAGNVSNRWGFWPAPDTFVPWREWK